MGGCWKLPWPIFFFISPLLQEGQRGGCRRSRIVEYERNRNLPLGYEGFVSFLSPPLRTEATK